MHYMAKMKWYYVVTICAAWCAAVRGHAPPGSCPPVCVCKWKGGKQTVECVDRALITVPELVDPATQVLDLSGNNLQILPQEAFARTGLLNLQRVYLRSCSIGDINVGAFKGLTNLVELDLSHNLLTQIPSNSFRDAPFLRDLTLARNPILKVHADALSTLNNIVKLDLSQCGLREVAPDAFRNLKYLESLKLNGNNLHELSVASLETLDKLRAIDLSDNPWTCDCRLQEMKSWLAKRKLLSTPRCASPTRLADRPFSELAIEDFACKPEVLPVSRHVEAAIGENATLTCLADATPAASINWYWNGRLLVNETKLNSHQRVYIFEKGDIRKKSSLILTNSQEPDSGEFYCVAENKGGNAEANFTVHITMSAAGVAALGGVHIVSLAAALFLTVVVVCLTVLAIIVRMRSAPACESKTPSTLERVVSGNGVRPAAGDKPCLAPLAERAEAAHAPDPKRNPVSKPPRTGEPPYPTNHSEGRGSGGAGGGPPVISPTVSAGNDPDLINDTRPESAPRPASGEYAREASDSLYPSGLWEHAKRERAAGLVRAASSALPAFYSDRTPIMETCSADGSQEELGYGSRTFPRTHALAAAPAAAAPDGPYPADYGLPVGGGAGARTLRVWQRAPPVLPPVSALKRALASSRHSPDEGYQEGCATDV